MNNGAVFSTACFPTIEYMSFLLKEEPIYIEAFEYFIKQTNRNRYHIAGPSGVQALYIPVAKNTSKNVAINEIRISYDEPWQRTHWRSIMASYNRSAYFEYYKDELEKLFFKRHDFLLKFNMELLDWVLASLKITKQMTFTELYQAKTSLEMPDYRYISNERTNSPLTNKPFKNYPQVFSQQSGFIANLSIIDLLFNTGPASLSYL